MLPTLAPNIPYSDISSRVFQAPGADRPRLHALLELRHRVDAEIAREAARLGAEGVPVPAETADHALLVLGRIAALLEVPIADLRGPYRGRRVVDQRHLAAWLLHHHGASLHEIGRALKRDHTTVLHSVRRVDGCPVLLDRATGLAARLTVSRADDA